VGKRALDAEGRKTGSGPVWALQTGVPKQAGEVPGIPANEYIDAGAVGRSGEQGVVCSATCYAQSWQIAQECGNVSRLDRDNATMIEVIRTDDR
jgi:hypothetical protein